MTIPYINQCDRIISEHRNGESFWHEMMKNKEEIEPALFEDICDTSILFDDDETLDMFMSGDPDTAIYKSKVKDVECFFIQHSGFEFIFGNADVMAVLNDPSTKGLKTASIFEMKEVIKIDMFKSLIKEPELDVYGDMAIAAIVVSMVDDGHSYESCCDVLSSQHMKWLESSLNINGFNYGDIDPSDAYTAMKEYLNENSNGIIHDITHLNDIREEEKSLIGMV